MYLKCDDVGWSQQNEKRSEWMGECKTKGNKQQLQRGGVDKNTSRVFVYQMW